MLRHALLLAPFLLFGCASPLTNPVMAGDAANVSVAEAPRVVAPADPDAATENFTDFASGSQTQPGTPPPRPRERFTLKGGYYGSNEDEFDDGYIINASYLRPMNGPLSSEVELGYLDATGTDHGVDTDVWAIPLLVNGRFTIPIGEKMEAYGGLGLGTFYYDGSVEAGGVKVSADGFLVGGDAFFGGSIHLGENLWVGIEGKYYETDNASELGGGLDAYVVMLTVGMDK